VRPRSSGPIAVAVALLVALAGCAPPVTGPVSTVDSGLTAPSLAPWEPAHPIVLPPMSDAEAMQLRAEGLANEAKTHGVVDPPVVALIRWTSLTDNGVVVAACLREAGFDALGAANGIWFPGAGVGPAQMSAYELARYVCDAEYTIHPKYLQPLTDAQWGLQYDYWVEWLVPCLEGLGAHPSEPPTRDTFVAQAVQGKISWDPYSSVQGTPEYASSIEKTVLLNQTCPVYSMAVWGE